MNQQNDAVEYYPQVMLHLTKAIIIAPFLREPTPEGRDELKMERWRETIVIGQLYQEGGLNDPQEFKTFEGFARHYHSLNQDMKYAVAQVMFHNPQPCWVYHSAKRPFRRAIEDLIATGVYRETACLEQLLVDEIFKPLIDA